MESGVGMRNAQDESWVSRDLFPIKKKMSYKWRDWKGYSVLNNKSELNKANTKDMYSFWILQGALTHPI